MSLLTAKTKFLYPCSRQFPFDEVAERIVRELEKRNWQVPTISVEFESYGSGEAKYQHVYHITGKDFKLEYMRVQGRVDSRRNDIAAIHEICIPKQILEVYDDESGPTYYLYVGDDWNKDKDWFMNSIKVNSKLNGQPRRYLRYTGESYSYYSGRAQFLVADEDLGREYSPKNDEPKRFKLSQKMDEFTTWLEENVLQYILSFPEAKIINSSIADEELIPYHGPWKTVYTICGSRVDVIQKGKIDKNLILPENRFALAPGWRLINLGVPRQNRFPSTAYDGFIWCDVNQNINDIMQGKFMYEIQNKMLSSITLFYYVIAVKPKYANNVYVVDNYPYESTRKNFFNRIVPREYLTDAEINEAYINRAATIVPIHEYKGNYIEPIVLISRELDFDEVEIIKRLEK